MSATLERLIEKYCTNNCIGCPYCSICGYSSAEQDMVDWEYSQWEEMMERLSERGDARRHLHG